MWMAIFTQGSMRVVDETAHGSGGAGVAVVRGVRGPLFVIAVILVCAALSWGSMVFAPAAFAVFLMMVVRPLESRLTRIMPRVAAIVVTLAATLVCVSALFTLFAIGLTVVSQGFIRNAAQFQDIYLASLQWLEGHGIELAAPLADLISVPQALRIVQGMVGRINGFGGFAALVFGFLVLGMLETDNLISRIKAAGGRIGGVDVLALGRGLSAQFGKYLLVRTTASAVTALAVWLIAYFLGLEHPAAWAAIAFTLNYIPYLGPLVATALPSLFALAQFGELDVALLVLACLTGVQFIIGSYIEPLLTGSALSLSAFAVMLTVFLWTLLWGLCGTFIGVPILVAALAVSREVPALRWFAVLLSGGKSLQPPPAETAE